MALWPFTHREEDVAYGAGFSTILQASGVLKPKRGGQAARGRSRRRGRAAKKVR